MHSWYLPGAAALNEHIVALAASAVHADSDLLSVKGEPRRASRRPYGEDGLSLRRKLLRRKVDLRRTQTHPCGNGPEFISKALDRWAYENGSTLDFSPLGKSTDNAAVESLNHRLRDECLNARWFLSLADAKVKIEA